MFPFHYFPYTNVLQAQLRTGRGKPRVWFATSPEGPIVIKGPVSAKEREGVRQSERLKQQFGLPHANFREKGDYLLWDCLFDYTTLQRHIASSPFDIPTEVPVQEFHYPWDDSYLGIHALDILTILAFRKIIGAHDTCIQNIMVVNGKVYSIDDAALEKETPFMWKHRAGSMWAKVLQEQWEPLQDRLRNWKVEGPMLERLRVLQNPRGWKW